MSESTHDRERQAAREFKIGTTLLAVLFCTFIAVAYRHYRMSFSDPPAAIAARAPLPNANSSALPVARNLKSVAPRPIRPTFEVSRNTAFQLPPPVLPPPSDLSQQAAEVDGARAEQGQHPPLPDEFPAPAFEVSPPNLTEPAAFQEKPDEVEIVQQTQFQASDVQSGQLELVAPTAATPPQTFSVEGPSKPIDLSTRVEPIRQGDSFWLISQRAYGDGGYFRALYEHNRERFPEPDDLPAGSPVEIPSAELLRQQFPYFCPARTTGELPNPDAWREYTVVGGESLFDVARFQLGQGFRYVEILEMNRAALAENVDALPAGLKLRLPRQ